MDSHPTIEYISECFIQPKHTPQDSRKPLFFSAWDLALINLHYNHKGLLFAKPPSFNTDESQKKDFLEKLKDSLSVTLIHFYPLTGRLATLEQDNPKGFSFYVDSENGPGAKFIHASLDLTVGDILSPLYVPRIVYSFFDHVGAINYDGLSLPLMSVQVTELIDGIFIGPSINHMLVDGSSFWHFISTWSEIFNAMSSGKDAVSVSRPPIHDHWFPDGSGPILNLPFSSPDEIISRYKVPQLKERIFHFSAESLRKLKAKANAECDTTKISTLQALCALVWRCLTRARGVSEDETIKFGMAVDSRSRIIPPLPNGYFGNCIIMVATTVNCGELMDKGLGWAAYKLHELVVSQTNKSAREWTESWVKEPSFSKFGKTDNVIQVGSSPRFNVYGHEFGLGKALAVRSGSANKYDGKIMFFPAREGGGNVDMEICLYPHYMTRFESDTELMESVSSTSAMINY